MKAWERLLNYVTVMTPSDEESETSPSSDCQFVLADRLVKELSDMQISASRDDKCYVYARIPASKGCEDQPCLGFIAHMDTVSDFADHTVKPVIHEKYNGSAVVLGESGRTLTEEMFPHLPLLAGRTLITTDGTTILGADDKAGIAEIMTLAEILVNSKIPHGPVAIGFTPDEEVGRGAEHFDVSRFGADFAYTVDGDMEGEIEYETFNAAAVKVNFNGVNVHPGTAKGIMVNAAAAACEFRSMLPEGETPEETEGYEGFYHIMKIKGTVAEAKIDMIVRDHDNEKFAARKAVLEEITETLNKKYGAGTVTMSWREQYRNMAEKIKDHFHLIDNAKIAAMRAGVTPKVQPVRGGTDGAMLSFMGLPCPNLGTGGFAFHGPYEHITVEGMDKVVQMLLNLVKIYSGCENMSCDA